MASSEVEVCNLALTQLGAQRITSLRPPDATTSARQCAAVFDAMRDEVLQEHPWTFALERQALAQLATNPSWEWAYAYQLPAEPYCLHVEDTDLDDDEEWVVEGRTLYCNSSSVSIRYRARITDPLRWSPAFATALAIRIAAEIAFAVTKKREYRGQKLDEYFAFLDRAAGIDSTQGNGYHNKDYGASALKEVR